MKRFFLLFFLYSVAVVATANPCKIVEILSVSNEIPIPLSSLDVTTPILPLSLNRLAYMVFTYGSSAGRLTVLDSQTHQVLHSVELSSPPTERGLPDFESSLRGELFAATSGGPVTVYESSPLNQLHLTEEEFRQFDAFIEPTMAILRNALAGNRWAREQVRRRSLSEMLREYRRNGDLLALEEEARVRELVTGAGPDPFEEASIDVRGIQFHPSGNELLVNTGEFATLREARSGREIRRVWFNHGGELESVDPPHAYYLGGGEYIAAVNRGHIVLWNSITGARLYGVSQPGQLELAFASTIVSPLADIISTAYRRPSENRNVRVLWRAVSSGPTVELRAVQEFSVPYEGSSNSFPVIAFSQQHSYAVGMPNGRVEVYSSATEPHPLITNFSLGDHTSTVAVSLSPNGRWLAAVGRSDTAPEFVELRQVGSNRGVRLQLPSLPRGNVIHIPRLRFTPDGERLVVEGQHFTADSNGSRRVIVFLVDVYRTLAHHSSLTSFLCAC